MAILNYCRWKLRKYGRGALINIRPFEGISFASRKIVSDSNTCTENIDLVTASLRSCGYSKNNELCMKKIHYTTMILYLNYMNKKMCFF